MAEAVPSVTATLTGAAPPPVSITAVEVHEDENQEPPASAERTGLEPGSSLKGLIVGAAAPVAFFRRGNKAPVAVAKPRQSIKDDEVEECQFDSPRFNSNTGLPLSHITEETSTTAEFDKEWKPELQDFIDAASRVKGPAGFDGWSAVEAKLMCKKLPWLAKDLFVLWTGTSVVRKAGGGNP